MAPIAGDTRSEWKRGWTLVLAASFGFSFFSVLLGAAGLFMEPITREFGWSKAFYSSGLGLATGITALLSLVYGIVIDRIGSRKLALPGILIVIASICSFALVSGSQTQWIVLWVMFGIAATSIKSTIWTTAVVGMFSKGRGLAIGLTVTGTAFAQMAVPPLVNWLIDLTSWRAAFVWLGVGWGGVALLLSYLFLYDRHDHERAAIAAATIDAPAKPKVQLPGLRIPQALRCWPLWQVAISSFIVMTVTIGLGVHLFPILTESGVDRGDAAWLLALGGAAGIVGKLITGALIDRFKPNWIGGITMGVTAVTFYFLHEFIDSMTAIIIAVIVNGYAAGTKTQITAYLTAGYAGMRNFATIYSVMSAIVAAAAGLGPVLAGYLFDRYGEYGQFLWVGIVASVVGGVMIILLPPLPKWEEESEAEVFA